MVGSAYISALSRLHLWDSTGYVIVDVVVVLEDYKHLNYKNI